MRVALGHMRSPAAAWWQTTALPALVTGPEQSSDLFEGVRTGQPHGVVPTIIQGIFRNQGKRGFEHGGAPVQRLARDFGGIAPLRFARCEFLHILGGTGAGGVRR